MADALFAADRGYNTKETLSFVGTLLGASILGTHKRDLSYPFVFDNVPITNRSKAMVVSENGCRAVYVATKKADGAARRIGWDLEACLYRESCSGRIAAMIHNNKRLFKSRSFTIVPHNRFRALDSLDSIRSEQVIYDAVKRSRNQRDGGVHVASYAAEYVSSASIVDLSLNRIKVLTFHQSEDPVWFLLRAFRFTSRTGHAFLNTITRDFEKNVDAMGWELRGKTLATGSDVLPREYKDCKSVIRFKWERACSFLGMRLQSIPQPSARRDLAHRILRYSRSRINAFTRNDLQQMLDVFGRDVSVSSTKAVLVHALQELKSDINTGTVQLDEAPHLEPPLESRMTEAFGKLTEGLREASLRAWVMKPLFSRAGMREGSQNEIEILRSIPTFLRENVGAYAKENIMNDDGFYCFTADRKLIVNHIRAVGLIESKSSPMIADSPDAIMACADEGDHTFCWAAEMKTMTALATVNAANNLRDVYGPVCILSNVRSSATSDELFRTLVPSTQYRAQCMHHAAALQLSHVLYLVGTSGTVTHERIIYACIIEFSENIRHSYTYTLHCVQSLGFQWVGKGARYIPKEYDGLLKQSHTSDINNL